MKLKEFYAHRVSQFECHNSMAFEREGERKREEWNAFSVSLNANELLFLS